MSTAEIIAELPRLSAADLAQVQAKLRELVAPSHDVPRPPRIHSPRPARPEQFKDFMKQVVELAPDAGYDALHYDPPAPIAQVILPRRRCRNARVFV